MHRSLYAAWALAFCASSADAFMPASSAVPALRAKTATAMAGRMGSKIHAPGCSCGSCSAGVLGRKGAAKLSMTAADTTEFVGKGMDSQTYAEALNTLFPGAVDEQTFIDSMSRVLYDKGFNPDSAINLVSTCRDEICRPFTEKLDGKWGEHFSISSLGGMVFCGTTGFGAGMAHSPQVGGKERYAFWAGPHIAFGTAGEVGQIYRAGRAGISNACGALIALNGQIASGKLDTQLNPTDTEMSLLRQAVLSKLSYGQQPNLVGITYAAHDVIKEQVEMTAEKAASKEASEYVIISGVQIHGALGYNYWWPGSITHYANGKATDLNAEFEKAISYYNLVDFINGKALEHAQASAGMRLPALAADVV